MNTFTPFDIHIVISRRHRVDEFYAHLNAFEETRRFIDDPAMLERLKLAQAEYFKRLTAGEYGWDYILDRLRVGVAHQRIGLDPQWYFGAYRKYLCWLLPTIRGLYRDEPDLEVETLRALIKVLFLDMGIAIDSCIYADKQALASSKAYLEKVLSNVPCGMVVLRKDHGVRLVNLAFQKLLGMQAEPVQQAAPRVRAILLEDDDDLRELVGDMLKPRGYEVEAALAPMHCTLYTGACAHCSRTTACADTSNRFR